MITPATYWAITCSVCRDELTYDDGEERFWQAGTLSTDDAAAAAEDLNYDDWTVIRGQLVCEHCQPDCDCDCEAICVPAECDTCTRPATTPVTAEAITLTAVDAYVLACDAGCGAILQRHNDDGVLLPAYTTPDNVADPQRSYLSGDLTVAGWEHDPATGKYRCTRCRRTDAQAEWCSHHHLMTDQCAHCQECLMCSAGYGIRPLDAPYQQHGLERCPHCGTRTTVPAPGDPCQPALF